MWLKTNNTVILISMIVFCSIIVFCSGCSSEPTISIKTPAEGYKLYEMKPDDIRLTWLNHPLYSFEYPEVFILWDWNKVYVDSIDANRSEVTFYRNESEQIPQDIIISVLKPIPQRYNNAADVAKNFSSTFTGNAIEKKVVISGIDAIYLLSPPPGPSDVVDRIKVVIFDYANLIWSISLITYFPHSEPPETEAYFNHIIETFKIEDK